MTTIQINLPDQLAEEAKNAGLLTPATLEQLLRERLKARQVDELFAAMERMSETNEPPVMTPEEVADEIRVMRRERQHQ